MAKLDLVPVKKLDLTPVSRAEVSSVKKLDLTPVSTQPSTPMSIAGQFGGGLVEGVTAGIPALGYDVYRRKTMGEAAAKRELEKERPKGTGEKIARGAGTLIGSFAPIGLAGKVVRAGIAITPKLAALPKMAMAAVEGGASFGLYDLLSVDQDEIYRKPGALETIKEAGIGTAIGGALGPIGAKIGEVFGKPASGALRGSPALDKTADMIAARDLRRQKSKIGNMVEDVKKFFANDSSVQMRIADEFRQAHLSPKYAGNKMRSYESARLLAGAPAYAHQRIVDSMTKIMSGIGKRKDMFEQYMELKAAKDMDLLRTSMINRPGPFSEDYAKKILDKYEGYQFKKITAQEADEGLSLIDRSLTAEEKAGFGAAEQEYRGLLDEALDDMVDSGIKSRAEAAAMRKINPNYIRMKVIRDDLASYFGSGRGMQATTPGFLMKKGGTERDIDDIFESAAEYATLARLNAEKNRTLRLVIDEDRMVDPAHRLLKRVKGETPNSFYVYRKGNKTYWEGSKAYVETIKGLNKEQTDIVTKVASNMGRMFRESVTALNPAFIMANAPQDFVQAWSTTNVGFGPRAWAKGFVLAMNRNNPNSEGYKLYRQYLKEGGGMGGIPQGAPLIEESMRNAGVTQSNVIVNGIDRMRAAALTTELSTRLGVFKRGLEKGLSPKEAAFVARNSSVDFAKAGDTARVLNLWVPFYNANVQGFYNNLDAATSKNRALRDHFWKVTSGSVIIPAATTAYYSWKNFPDVMKNISSTVKENNIVIPYGRGFDETRNEYTQVLLIPRPRVAKLVGLPIEKFIEYAYDKDKLQFYGIGHALGQESLEAISAANPYLPFMQKGKFDPLRGAASSLLPPVVKGAVEYATGENLFTGKKIPPMALEGASPAMQFDSTTPKSLVAIADVAEPLFNISPMRAENFIRTAFGPFALSAISPEKFVTQVRGRFLRAYANGEHEPMFEVVRDVKEDYADEKSESYRQFEGAIRGFRAIPEKNKEARRNFFLTNMPKDEGAKKKFIDSVYREIKGEPSVFNVIRGLSINEKVKFIREYSDRMGYSPEQRMELYLMMRTENIISEDAERRIIKGDF